MKDIMEDKIKLVQEDFHNPFEVKEKKEKKSTHLSDKGGYLKKRKESFNPSRIEYTKRPGGEYTIISRTHFARGEIVEICPVVVVNELARTIDGLKDIIFEIDKDTNTWAIVLGYGSMYKHSDKPNCDFAYNKMTKQMYIITRKTINVVEELTINYGVDYWEERTNFNMMGDERTDQNQGMPLTANPDIDESEVQPNSSDIKNTGNIKQLSSPTNRNNPVYTGVAIQGAGQS